MDLVRVAEGIVEPAGQQDHRVSSSALCPAGTILSINRGMTTPMLTVRGAMTLGLLAAVVLGLVASTARPAEPDDPPDAPTEQVGLASFYGPGFQGEETASGRPFDQHAMVAAHRTLPLGTLVRVTNLENRRTVTVRIIDRGPYGRNRRKGTIIDLSTAAARRLRFVRDGLAKVRVQVLPRPQR